MGASAEYVEYIKELLGDFPDLSTKVLWWHVFSL